MRCRGRKKSRFDSCMKPLIRESNVCGRFFGDWLRLSARCGLNSDFGTRAVVFVESSTVGMFASFLNFSSIIWPKIFEFHFRNPLFQSSSQRLPGFPPQRKREERITTKQRLSRPRLKIGSIRDKFLHLPRRLRWNRHKGKDSENFANERRQTAHLQETRRRASPIVNQPRKETACSLESPSCFS